MKYRCTVCGHIYDEEKEGVKFADLPDTWTCPTCHQPKSKFVPLDEENKTIYIFREWGDTNKTNGEIADIIKSLGFSKSTIICDSAEPKSIEELRRAGIAHVKASVKGPDSIIHGIQKLQQYKIVVHPDCPKTITELENYAW